MEIMKEKRVIGRLKILTLTQAEQYFCQQWYTGKAKILFSGSKKVNYIT